MIELLQRYGQSSKFKVWGTGGGVLTKFDSGTIKQANFQNQLNRIEIDKSRRHTYPD